MYSLKIEKLKKKDSYELASSTELEISPNVSETAKS